MLKTMKCNVEGLEEVEEIVENIDTGNLSKTS